MAQHNQSKKLTIRSAIKHKFAADKLIEVMDGLSSAIADARAKVDADANGSWDTDYGDLSVEVYDFDQKTIGQHKSSLRKILIDKLTHRRLGNAVSDALEEAQVTLNLVLAQMDADGGNLSADGVYDAYKISEVIDVDKEPLVEGQHQRSLRKVMISALSHKRFGNELSDQLESIESGINSLIEEIKAKN